MTIRNNQELELFEETIDRCSHTIWLISPLGKQYDLKNPIERYLGIAELLKSNEAEEPELFTSCIEDEMNIFDFLSAQRAFA